MQIYLVISYISVGFFVDAFNVFVHFFFVAASLR